MDRFNSFYSEDSQFTLVNSIHNLIVVATLVCAPSLAIVLGSARCIRRRRRTVSQEAW
jgi:hypothetical protein